jgi:hypothetical protein
MMRPSRCLVCGSTSGIVIHHVIPKSVLGPASPEAADFEVPLCVECHQEIHLVPSKSFVESFLRFMDSKREKLRKSGKEVPTFDAKEISDPLKRFKVEKLIYYIETQAKSKDHETVQEESREEGKRYLSLT